MIIWILLAWFGLGLIAWLLLIIPSIKRDGLEVRDIGYLFLFTSLGLISAFLTVGMYIKWLSEKDIWTKKIIKPSK